MRKTIIALLVLGCAGAAQAAEVKIAVVDPMAAISGTDQYKKAAADLDKDTADEKAKLTKLQSDLKIGRAHV